jgi:hypothetical protein
MAPRCFRKGGDGRHTMPATASLWVCVSSTLLTLALALTLTLVLTLALAWVIRACSTRSVAGLVIAAA